MMRPPDKAAVVPLDVLERVDEICASLESAWRAGPEPELEQFLGKLPEPAQKYLLMELLQTDRECRRAHGLPVRPADRPGGSVSPPGYELLAEIGRGGMGVVHCARDLRLGREVAVKLLRADAPCDTLAVARFRAEAHATGQLQHPGIPAVHELGTLPDGRPFLVMKLVQGRTLQELLKDRPDHDHDRGRFLAAFEQLCQAVGYAHAHGVIHRDLKPSNVMVGEHGEVQVMDWGLAKRLTSEGQPEPSEAADEQLATQASVSLDTPVRDGSATRTGSVMGTPAYLAPEQAAGEIRKLNARSDVFGLGAILCQLLTGRPPYAGDSANDLRIMAVRGETAEALQALDGCGAEPGLISLCKQCLALRQEERPADGVAVAAEVARVRDQAEARARRAELDRAEALVRDVEQRRRRHALRWAAGAVAAVLVLGLVGTTAGLIQADAARRAEKARADSEAAAKRDAQTQREAAARAAETERQAKEDAQRRLEQIERGVELLAGLLRGLDPRAEARGALPLYEQLRARAAEAADALVGESIGDPEMVARLQTILGQTLLGLGDAAKAAEVLQRARVTREARLGADHPHTLATVGTLAAAYQDAGKLTEAIALYEKVRDARQAKLGADHPDNLVTLHNLASAYQAAGKPRQAIALFEQIRDANVKRLGADHRDTLATMNNLASAYQNADRLPEAIAVYERLRDATVETLGADHPDTLSTLNNLGLAYREAGKPRQAIALLEPTRDTAVKKLGDDHPTTLVTLNNLALAYRDVDRLREAIALLEQVRDANVKRLGSDHPHTLTTLGNLGSTYLAAGKLPEAIAQLEQAAASVEKRRFQHQHAGPILRNTIAAYEQAEQFDRAEVWRRKWLVVVKERAGADSPAYAGELAWLGLNLLRQKKWAEAEEPIRESLAIREKMQADAWTTFNTTSMLGGALLGQKKHDQARPMLLRGYRGMKEREDTIPAQGKPRLVEAVDRLIELYTATDKPDQVKKWQAERAALTKQTKAPDKK